MCRLVTRWGGPGGIEAYPYDYYPSVLSDTVGWVIWPVKPVPDMTYTVFSGTLNPTQSITDYRLPHHLCAVPRACTANRHGPMAITAVDYCTTCFQNTSHTTITKISKIRNKFFKNQLSVNENLQNQLLTNEIRISLKTNWTSLLMIYPLWTIIHVQLSTGEHGAPKLSSFKWQFWQMCSQVYSRQASADLGLVFSVLFLTVLSVDLNLLLRLLLRLLQTTRFACLYTHKSRLIISDIFRILNELSALHSFQCFQSVECQKERPAHRN